MRKGIGVALLSGLALAAPASAQMAVKDISLKAAQELANATLEDCAKKGFRVAVTVVDRDGRVKLIIRGDGTGPHTLSTSRRKAFTALTFKATTIATVERVARNPGAANLKDISGVLLLGGGVPIKIGSEVVGAVGVSGAPGGDKDEACAMVGLKKIEGMLR
ncbi:MAG: heme-binding protein [Candidatus Tectomicrobia bacterium]|uniref:Heme-binding protein n=1 Tax=Tectimicrobiota bacterium TaxID=2528274 RepID=A0A933E789_UNCTE|nr:heme-binding protein [Candidatus Tectomicrobia bacterium]